MDVCHISSRDDLALLEWFVGALLQGLLLQNELFHKRQGKKKKHILRSLHPPQTAPAPSNLHLLRWSSPFNASYSSKDQTYKEGFTPRVADGLLCALECRQLNLSTVTPVTPDFVEQIIDNNNWGLVTLFHTLKNGIKFTPEKTLALPSPVNLCEQLLMRVSWHSFLQTQFEARSPEVSNQGERKGR